MKYLNNKINIYFFIFSFLCLFTFIFIYDIFLNENFLNYNFHYKSNVLDFYSQKNDKQLLKSYLNYNYFIDLSLGTLLANYIFSKIPQIVGNKKTSFHLQIIWLIKIFFIFTVFSIYERTLILDQNVFFMGTINNFETFEFLDFKSKYISEGLSSVILLYLLQVVNLFLFNSWFSFKVFLTLLYLITVIYSFKIVGLFVKKNNFIFLYILSFVPSFFYSSSLIVKDILILPFITIFLFHYFKLFFKLNREEMIKIILIIIFSIFIIGLFRLWMAFSCIMCVLIFSIYLLTEKIKIILDNNKFKVIYFVIFLFSLFSLFLFFIEESIKFHSILQFQISDSYRNFIANENYNSGSNLFNNIENYKDFFYKLPVLYFYSAFNPFLESIFEFKYFFPIFENIIFCILIISTFFIKKFPKNFKLLIIVYLTYIFIFLNIYMFVSYASIGTGFRYSIQFKIPLLTFLFILNKEKLDYYFLFFSKKLKKIVFRINDKVNPKQINDR